MKKEHLVFFLVFLAVLGTCTGTVSATDSLSVVGTTLSSATGSGYIQVNMPYGKNGLSGYIINITLDNPGVASLTPVCPSWATTGYCTGSSWTGNAFVKLADVTNTIVPPVSNANLFSVAVKGTTSGCSNVNAVVTRMDDDFGNAVTPVVSPGYLVVGSATGTLKVNSSPTGAWIFIDGVNRSVTTNTTITSLPAGAHTIVLNLTGYANQTMQVIVPCSGTVLADFGTLPKIGTFTINSVPSGARIYLELDPQTDTGLTTNKSLSVPYGYHWFTVKLSGYQDASIQKSVTSLPQSYTFTLVSTQNAPPPYGALHVDSTPQGAEVFVDNTDQNIQTPAEFGVLVGSHDIKVTLSGYSTPAVQSVAVLGCQTAYMDFALEKTASIPAKVKILPDPLNIGRPGKFLAFVVLPKAYYASDVNTASVACDGVPALRVIRFPKLFPHLLIAVFDRNNPNIVTGKSVPIQISGLLTNNGKTLQFIGVDNVWVIKKTDKLYDATDNLDRMTDDQVYRSFYPGGM